MNRQNDEVYRKFLENRVFFEFDLTKVQNVSIVFSQPFEFPIELKKNILRDSQLKCRLCGKTVKEGETFDKISHIIPEFIGNNIIIGKYECDTCNQKFSNIERDLRKFLVPYLYSVGIMNTKKNMTYYNNDKKSKNAMVKNMKIKADFGDMTEINCQDKIIKERIITEKYVPYDAFLGMCKIALLIVPEEELNNFEYLKSLINREKIYENNIVIKVKLLDINRIREVSYISIIKRKNEYTMILGLRNYIFEIKLPIREEASATVTKNNSFLFNEEGDVYISLEDKKVIDKTEKELIFSVEQIIEINEMSEEQKEKLKRGCELLFPNNQELKNSF